MKLFNVKLTTLKSKLYAIVFASFVVRVVAFFLLTSEPTVALAPDEFTYSELTEWVSKNKAANEFPYSGLYTVSRAFIIPASLL